MFFYQLQSMIGITYFLLLLKYQKSKVKPLACEYFSYG